MNSLVISIVAILVLAIFVAIFLMNSRTGHNIKLQGKMLTIGHPLKEDVIDLEKDLSNWNVTRMNLMWRGRLYVLNLELNSRSWKKIYFRSPTGNIQELIAKLDELIPLEKDSSFPYAG